ncbi:MAG: hypothetical protein MUO52_18965 [Desulfobacterales bacterium]|nr:hypothetical protein [Desulfobacterales bacterium]
MDIIGAFLALFRGEIGWAFLVEEGFTLKMKKSDLHSSTTLPLCRTTREDFKGDEPSASSDDMEAGVQFG